MSQDTLEMPRLIGGVLGLDFVNTVDPRHAPGRREYLDSYPALVAWGRQAGVVDAAGAPRLLAAAADDPAGAERVLSRAIELREATYRIFARAARRQPAAPGDLDVLHGELGRAMTHIRVGCSDGGFGWEWQDAGDNLDPMLWPVTWSAAGLLVHGPLDRIKECPGDRTCGWLFLDVSKNASRRWCRMDGCGNRAKARRHYERARADQGRAHP